MQSLPPLSDYCVKWFQDTTSGFQEFLDTKVFFASSKETGERKALSAQCHVVKKRWGCDYRVDLIEHAKGSIVKYGDIRFSSYLPGKEDGEDVFYPVTIESVESYRNKEWKNIGTQLVYVAHQASQRMGNGQVTAFSLPSAVAFYDKMGFTIDWEAYDESDEEEQVGPAVAARVQTAWKRCMTESYKEGDAVHLVLDSPGDQLLLQRMKELLNYSETD